MMLNDKNITTLSSGKGLDVCVQLSLFSRFLSNDNTNVSNTIEGWETIPKYFFTPQRTANLRAENGMAASFDWNFSLNSRSCSVRIQPALLEDKEGAFQSHFPGVTEELVEEALKKILTMQNAGSHDPTRSETWVRFSLRMVYKELKQQGKQRNIAQIKRAIEIMSLCVLTLYVEGKEAWRGPILQDLLTVGRDDYLADTDSHHIARLPIFLSKSINSLEYRQINYSVLMSLNEQLSRWIYKRLVNRFVQASVVTTYSFTYTSLKSSGLLQNLEKSNRRKVASALSELVDKGVVRKCHSDTKYQGRKVIDIVYTITPSQRFISEQKAANKRLKNDKSTMNKKNTHSRR